MASWFNPVVKDSENAHFSIGPSGGALDGLEPFGGAGAVLAGGAP
jgi:hypothetical protein